MTANRDFWYKHIAACFVIFTCLSVDNINLNNENSDSIQFVGDNDGDKEIVHLRNIGGNGDLEELEYEKDDLPISFLVPIIL